MIQDIAPHKLNNSYQAKQPQENSAVLFFEEDTVFVVEEPGQSGRFEFPRYKDVQNLAGETVYLFTLDDTDFFRSANRIDAEIIRKSLPDAEGCNYVPRSYFRTAGPKEYAFAAITGLHLNGWYRKNRYCGACSAPLVHDTKERMLRCLTCGNIVFPRINPAVIVAVTNSDSILLTKYRGREYKKYALVAGFNEIGESLEETVEREVMEDTGLKVKNIRYYKSQPWGFTDNILAGYYCDLDGDDRIRMDDNELSVAEWVKRDEIPVRPEDLSLTNEMICRFFEGDIPK